MARCPAIYTIGTERSRLGSYLHFLLQPGLWCRRSIRPCGRRFLRRDLRFSRLFLTPSTYGNRRSHSDHLLPSSLVHSLLRQRQGYLRARLSQCRCAFGHALWSIFKAWRAILLLDVHSSDSKMMRNELPCEIYACECPPISFFAKKSDSGSCLALRGGYITIWVDF